MSAKLMGTVWECDLPHNEMIVLLALADHANDDGDNVFPGIPYVAWKTGYTDRQVQRIMRSLEEKHILVPVEWPEGRPTVYRIDIDKAPRKQPFKRAHTKALRPAAPKPQQYPRKNVIPTNDQGVTKLHQGVTFETEESQKGCQNVTGGVTFEALEESAIQSIETRQTAPKNSAQPSWNHHELLNNNNMGNESPNDNQPSLLSKNSSQQENEPVEQFFDRLYQSCDEDGRDWLKRKAEHLPERRRLQALAKEYGESFLIEALTVAAQQSGQSIAYVKGICQRSKDLGKTPNGTVTKTPIYSPPAPPKGPPLSREEIAAWQATKGAAILGGAR